MILRVIFTGLLFFARIALYSQLLAENKFIHTLEGARLQKKSILIEKCKQSYSAPSTNKLVHEICDCQVNLLDRRYSTHQLNVYRKKFKELAFEQLMKEDTALQRQLRECTAQAEKLTLFSIPAYQQNFVRNCVENLKRSAAKPVSDTSLMIFCGCAADVMKKREIGIQRFDELSDPSSFLYNEVMYKCGSPFLKPSDYAPGWKASDSTDIKGIVIRDTIAVIPVWGMHKVKITIGSITRIWLLDSGATDLLISEEFEKLLREQGSLSDLNFAGEGVYTLADNRQISCKKYKIDSVRVGRFTINNVMLASSKETKEFLLGKSLLNKFSQWSLDNKNNLLMLAK